MRQNTTFVQKQDGLTFGSSFHLQNVDGDLVQKRAWCKFLSPKHRGDSFCAITSRSYFAQKYHTFEPNFSQEIRVWSFGASSWAQNTSRIVFCAKTSRTYFLEKYSSFKSSFLCKIKRLDLWCEFWVSFSWNWKLLIESTVQRARSKKLAE